MLHAICPKLPYEKNFKFEAQPGLQVVITGHTHSAYLIQKEHQSINGFSVNLIGEHRFDGPKILHVNPRYDSQNIILNTRDHNGGWGHEEIHPDHYFRGEKEFVLAIQAHQHEFKLFANGAHFADYKYRLPIESVTGLQIDHGQVTIHQVVITRHEVHAIPPLPVFNPQPIVVHSEFPIKHEKPEIPIHVQIPGHQQGGLVFALEGKPLENAERFYINWLTHANDIAFHFNPRFNDGHVVVRNSKVGDHWGAEERNHESPFHHESKFRLYVKVHHDRYEVCVNGVHFCDFHHRVHPVHEVTAIEIKGDVKIKHLTITY